MISRLHYITQEVDGFSHSELAEFACKGGADWIQLRVKNKSQKDWLDIAKSTKLICKKYGAKLIINDNVQIAKEVEADGVHLGKEDMNPLEARNILGQNSIIGGSANTVEDVNRQIKNGCDYIGIGPFRFTSTKENLNPVLGIIGIEKTLHSPLLRREVGLSSTGGREGEVPIIAIGGITLDDVKTLMNIGVYGLAVSSAISLAEDKTAITKKFKSEIISV